MNAAVSDLVESLDRLKNRCPPFALPFVNFEFEFGLCGFKSVLDQHREPTEQVRSFITQNAKTSPTARKTDLKTACDANHAHWSRVFQLLDNEAKQRQRGHGVE